MNLLVARKELSQSIASRDLTGSLKKFCGEIQTCPAESYTQFLIGRTQQYARIASFLFSLLYGSVYGLHLVANRPKILRLQPSIRIHRCGNRLQLLEDKSRGCWLCTWNIKKSHQEKRQLRDLAHRSALLWFPLHQSSLHVYKS